ncbi:MAG: hypothetical protein HZB50_17030 [Chloroflexi bacterium]|nr:hypothetical protein [Chloroflexota bacterium]
MRSSKVFFLFLPTILLILACNVGNIPQPTPTVMPTETRTVTASPTRTVILTPLPVDPTAVSIPLWVTDFADPILMKIVDRTPDFQDDFSLYRGWLNVMSGVDGYVYAERENGMLFLRLPERTQDSILYNPRLNLTNFVLTLELRFDHDQPEDTVRFQFDQFPNQSVALDLSNNTNWKIHWGFQDSSQSMAGVYGHSPPENVPVTILMRGTQCAVYLNNDPLTYSGNCRADSTSRSHGWVVSFRLLSDNESAVAVSFDNLKLWDLDKIPDLP